VSLPARARLWHLLAFGVLAPTNSDWQPFVAWQTEYLLKHDRSTVVSRDDGALRSLNFILLPLGLACGKSGAPMTEVVTALRQSVEQGDREMTVALIEGLGIPGLYYPVQALSAIESACDKLSDLPTEELIDTLSFINVLHPSTVELFLEDAERVDLASDVRARADIVKMRRAIDQVGFFNSSIYQASHNPIMRERLTKPALRCLTESFSVKQFARRYAKILLNLAREYDYHPGEWAAEDP
jgi:hypothetical protein